jgi:hypothetical protein
MENFYRTSNQAVACVEVLISIPPTLFPRTYPKFPPQDRRPDTMANSYRFPFIPAGCASMEGLFHPEKWGNYLLIEHTTCIKRFREEGDGSSDLPPPKKQKGGRESAAYKREEKSFWDSLINNHQERLKPCSGRDEMCQSVLNDDWASHPTWASEDSGFVAHRKNAHEEGLHRIEEERHDYDFNIEANAKVIQLLEPIGQTLLSMEPAERENFRMPIGLGGQSQSIYKRVLKKIYGERGPEVAADLFRDPSAVLPVVLARLKQKDEEWRFTQVSFPFYRTIQMTKMFPSVNGRRSGMLRLFRCTSKVSITWAFTSNKLIRRTSPRRILLILSRPNMKSRDASAVRKDEPQNTSTLTSLTIKKSSLISSAS